MCEFQISKNISGPIPLPKSEEECTSMIISICKELRDGKVVYYINDKPFVFASLPEFIYECHNKGVKFNLKRVYDEFHSELSNIQKKRLNILNFLKDINGE